MSAGMAWLSAGAALALLGATPARAEVIRVTIDKLVFAPAQVTARVGDTIEWVNKDFLAHTATARDKKWDVTIAPGKTSKMVVKAAGTVEYFCRFHPTMIGRLTVSEK
jgi:plastocyanin